MRYQRPPSPYERYMEEQAIPIYREIGFHDVRDLELGPWQRQGGRGAFVLPSGTGSMVGLYLIEVPAGGELNAERHLFEELYLVIDGHGVTEMRRAGSSR